MVKERKKNRNKEKIEKKDRNKEKIKHLKNV